MLDSQKYRLLQELGAGGMGKVYMAELIGESGFKRPVVIKRLRQHEAGHIKLFVEEARRYAVLDHENIGRIFDFERVDGELSIVLEYIDGWSLVEFLERHRSLDRFPDPELSVFIASRVCRALQYVYEKAAIVHRDISPSNIMMTREGTVKLIDFGIATRSGTKDSTLTGKPAYMAPEMVVELRADNRSDLFSLGTVLFEMLTRERLFTGRTTAEVLEQVIAGQFPSPRSYNPSIPDGAMTILRKSLQRDPEKRFESAGEMGAACEHFLYDKGYGPTNLTLKKYLSALFPAGPQEALEGLDELEHFPVVEPTLLPIGDGAESGGEKTRAVARPAAPVAEAIAPEGTLPPDSTIASPATRASRRIKTRKR